MRDARFARRPSATEDGFAAGSAARAATARARPAPAGMTSELSGAIGAGAELGRVGEWSVVALPSVRTRQALATIACNDANVAQRHVLRSGHSDRGAACALFGVAPTKIETFQECPDGKTGQPERTRRGSPYGRPAFCLSCPRRAVIAAVHLGAIEGAIHDQLFDKSAAVVASEDGNAKDLCAEERGLKGAHRKSRIRAVIRVVAFRRHEHPRLAAAVGGHAMGGDAAAPRGIGVRIERRRRGGLDLAQVGAGVSDVGSGNRGTGLGKPADRRGDDRRGVRVACPRIFGPSIAARCAQPVAHRRVKDRRVSSAPGRGFAERFRAPAQGTHEGEQGSRSPNQSISDSRVPCVPSLSAHTALARRSCREP